MFKSSVKRVKQTDKITEDESLSKNEVEYVLMKMCLLNTQCWPQSKKHAAAILPNMHVNARGPAVSLVIENKQCV